jgi:uncharacterized protein (TIGR02118 family)
MLAFCAYYEGKPNVSPEEFDKYIRDIHMPLVAKYPNLVQLRYLQGAEGAKYYLAFELFFNSWDEFEVAKVSEERARAVEDAVKLDSMFDGEVTHVTYEMNEIPVA